MLRRRLRRAGLRLLRTPAVRRVDCLLTGRQPRNLQVSLDQRDIGVAGPDARELYARVLQLPGMFGLDDCGHFQLVLNLQRVHAISGDLLEIGVHGGRGAAMMAACLAPGEKLVLCDSFDLCPVGPGHIRKRMPEKVRANIHSCVPGVADENIIVHRCMSDDLDLPRDQAFRFVHIDGGHDADQAYRDLVRCYRHLVHGGVIALDDHDNPDCPGVARAARHFLDAHSDMSVLADMNRHGEKGRKLYMHKDSGAGRA